MAAQLSFACRSYERRSVGCEFSAHLPPRAGPWGASWNACVVLHFKTRCLGLLALRTPRPATGVFWAVSVSGPKCPRGCPRKRGVSEGVSDGVSPGPFGPRAPECPKSGPRVSTECQRRCPGHSGDILGTLFGPSGARGPKGPGDTPSDTPSDTPCFWGHSRGHSGDT